MSDYNQAADNAEKQLNYISPTMCYAKWAQVSLHLTNGMTNSCYHPPLHKIDEQIIKFNPKALHNTNQKKLERKMMLDGQRPSGCSYCWKIEDMGNRSDRIYRSGEYWAQNAKKDIIEAWDIGDINPKYVEVNFNQACNFKCMYCSPHLSTEWEHEIKQHGPFLIKDSNGNPSKHNDIAWLEKEGLMPLKVKQDENPYLAAFWNWWPELYKNLDVFRITGGEPLMDINTFKVLDHIYKNPNSDLEVSVTTNMCPPKQELMDKFIEKLVKLEEIQIWENKEKLNKGSGNHWYVNMALKNFSLFVSLDSVGKQAEYIRTGLDYELMQKNVLTYLNSTRNTTITFINTFNILSVFKIKEFLQYILDLRNQFSKENLGIKYIPIHDPNYTHPDYVLYPSQRIWFDVPLLRYPSWLNVELLSPGLEIYIEDAIEFMENNKDVSNFVGFYDFEIDKLKRNLKTITSARDNPSINIELEKTNFVDYFTQYDNRRGTSLTKTFPELEVWYNGIEISKETILQSIPISNISEIQKENISLTNLAICLYGSKDSDSTSIKELCKSMFSEKYKIDFFEHYEDEDLYKNLWLVNFKKRQFEINRLTDFEVCLALDVTHPWGHELPIPSLTLTDDDVLYFVKGEFKLLSNKTLVSPVAFFAKSYIFDAACAFTSMVSNVTDAINTKSIEEAFYYYLKTLKIKTRCVNHENGNLFKRTKN